MRHISSQLSALLLFGASVVFLSVGPITSAASTERLVGSSTIVLTPAETKALSVRAEFGLSATVDAVLAAEKAPTSNKSELGIPLDPQEAAIMAQRDRLPDIVQLLDGIITDRADYAGIWIDQSAGGVIHIMTTGPVTEVLSAAQAVIPADFPVTVDAAAFTLAQLQQSQDAIMNLRVENPSFRAALAISTIDVQANTLNVGLLAGASGDAIAAVNALSLPGVKLVTATRLSPGPPENGSPTKDRTGSPPLSRPSANPDAADSQPQHGQRDISTGPVLGGSYINELPTSQGGACTMGFSSYTSKTDGKPYGITAGHCGGAPVTYYQGYYGQGPSLGIGHEEKYANDGRSSNCDCVLTGPLVNARGSTLVYVSDLNTYSYGNTGVGNVYDQGMKVCFSGASYAYYNGGDIVCGLMDGVANLTYQDASFELTNAGITNITGTSPGDSGGPYGNGKSFLGIHAGAFNSGGLNYTGFSRALYFGTLNVNVTYGG